MIFLRLYLLIHCIYFYGCLEHCSNGTSNGKQTTTGDTHVMISYNWGHQKMVKQIRDHLRNNGFKVWMDVDDMQGSTLQAMASAVENADIVLVCYSLKYKNSDNCRAGNLQWSGESKCHVQ